MVGKIVQETPDRKEMELIVECPECELLHRVEIKVKEVASTSLGD